MSEQPVARPPSRPIQNPILSDDAVFDIHESAASVFYTARAQWISNHIELIVATAAGVCLLCAFTVQQMGGPAPLRDLFTLLAFATAGIPAIQSVWEKLRALRFDIDALMLLAAFLAAYIGSPLEGALLLFLFALAGGMEHHALRRTQRAVAALRQLSPKEALLIENGETTLVALRQVALGARMLVRPGEKIPLDGVVVDGSSSLDESAITGESIPRDCAAGSDVFAGTQNLNGRLEVRVTRLAAESTVARIVELVTDARQHPARAQRLIDRIGPTYSLGVMVVSLTTGVAAWLIFGVNATEATRRAIALLIVASPCALIIAPPVAYLSAIAGAARRGILIKGAVHLEMVARAGAFAFDKTGTLTRGNIRLTDIDFRGLAEDETLRIAGAIELASQHPLAKAVMIALKDRGLTAHAVTDHTAKPGEGESGIVQGKSVWIGRPESIDRHASPDACHAVAERTQPYREQGKVVAAIVVDGTVGLMAFRDTLRDEAKSCVALLRRQGVGRVEMLTGDHEIIAKQVAGEVELDGYQAALAPEDKVKATHRLQSQYGIVVLTGDGINDAPALAHADVGIAMGSMDVALEAADIVLMRNRIESVAWLHRHARATAKILRQNLALALVVITVLSVFAMLGRIPLPLAVVGHEGSTVLVALNALRLLRTPED